MNTDLEIGELYQFIPHMNSINNFYPIYGEPIDIINFVKLESNDIILVIWRDDTSDPIAGILFKGKTYFIFGTHIEGNRSQFESMS